MTYDTLNINTEVKEEFEKLRSDLRFKEKKILTQSELLKVLINVFKDYKKSRSKKQ